MPYEMTFKNMPVNIVISKSVKRTYKKRIGTFVRRRTDGREFKVLPAGDGKRYKTIRAGSIFEYVSYYMLRKYYV